MPKKNLFECVSPSHNISIQIIRQVSIKTINHIRIYYLLKRVHAHTEYSKCLKNSNVSIENKNAINISNREIMFCEAYNS